MGRHAHEVSVEVAVPAERALAYLGDGMNQGQWALGSWDRREAGGGLYAGRSLFDNSELFIRLTTDEQRLLVVYEVGTERDDLAPLVWARVVPGPVLGLGDDRCVITLVIWRAEGVDDDRWELLGHTFPTEVQMIRGRLELGF